MKIDIDGFNPRLDKLIQALEADYMSLNVQTMRLLSPPASLAKDPFRMRDSSASGQQSFWFKYF